MNNNPEYKFATAEPSIGTGMGSKQGSEANQQANSESQVKEKLKSIRKFAYSGPLFH